MKINHYGNVNFNPYKKQLEKMENVQQTAGKKDQLEISQAAKEMQQGTRIEAERAEKVEALKQQVKDGSYQVNPEMLAKKMYEFWNQ